MYLLLFLTTTTRFTTPEQVNKVVCAKIPDLLWDPISKLQALVIAHILHGPYRNNNLLALCMVYKHLCSALTCSKWFPKLFTDQTLIHNNGYLEYYCQDSSQTFTVYKLGLPGYKVVHNNHWVVFYSPYLL
jgi:hypothetical protein